MPLFLSSEARYVISAKMMPVRRRCLFWPICRNRIARFSSSYHGRLRIYAKCRNPTQKMTARHLIWPRLAAALFLVIAVLRSPAQAQPASLASWNDGPAQQAIVDFVRITTDKASQSYVPPEDRIATFDQDGTLWIEHPLFTQAMFALDRVRALTPAHPEWKTEQP